MTHPAVLEAPPPAKAALERVRHWFTREHVLTLDPGPRHLQIIEQCELHSNDSDFGRFPGLRWRDPLA